MNKSQTMLLRFSRRRTIWEGTDVQEMMETEFGSGEKCDLRASVYEVDSNSSLVVRAYAEHAASLNLNPKRGAAAIDLTDAAMTVTPGETLFQFTRDSHRELAFLQEAELRQFLVGILQNIIFRTHLIQKQPVLQYVKDRVESRDSEWIAFCADSPKPNDWGCPR